MGEEEDAYSEYEMKQQREELSRSGCDHNYYRAERSTAQVGETGKRS